MIPHDLLDFLVCCDRCKVEGILIGAYALAAHGLPRATGDIDMWIRPSQENAQRIYRALIEFGAPMSQFSPDDFTKADQVIQIGIAPVRIDILTSISGNIAFDDAWNQSLTLRLQDIPVRVLSVAHLQQNKAASGRPHDLEDLRRLRSLLP